MLVYLYFSGVFRQREAQNIGKLRVIRLYDMYVCESLCMYPFMFIYKEMHIRRDFYLKVAACHVYICVQT